MSTQRIYPHGAPCWVDTEQPDTAAACAFYGGLFGWTFQDAVPGEAPGSYLIASLDGRDVAAVGPGTGVPHWNTYVAVDDADATAAAVGKSGGVVVSPPADAGPGGRAAACTDPEGVSFRLWQARHRPGAQAVNGPGAWGFSHLRTANGSAALRFYGDLFGWRADDPGTGVPDAGILVRLPGYGDHLAATVDPGIHERQAAVSAPPGFADVVVGFEAVAPGDAARWRVVFGVTDLDAGAATAERLGATVLSRGRTAWTREALVRDPQGAEFTLSQFTPPGG